MGVIMSQLISMYGSNHMKYNWQHPNWPNFTFDSEVGKQSTNQYEIDSAKLSGSVSALKDADQYETYIELMLSEAISTSAIEGEVLDRDSVRSSLKNYLGLSVPPVRVNDPKAEGVAALMIDVRKNGHKELTKETLCKWHQMVLHEGEIIHQPLIGEYRQSGEPMVIASGPIGYEQVHYEAPPASAVESEMNVFLKWYNSALLLDGENANEIQRAAIAHLWFESIHPFDDGNGRIGRAIAEQALSCYGQQPLLLSLSSAIEKNKNEYYKQLHIASSPNMDVTQWVEYFSHTVFEAQQQAMEKVSFILSKTRFWDNHNDTPLSERQEKALRKVLDKGHDGFEMGINARKYQGLTNCSKATATRDLTDMETKGVLHKMPGSGRNTRYGISLPANPMGTIFSKDLPMQSG
jgi:Fic family protein